MAGFTKSKEGELHAQRQLEKALTVLGLERSDHPTAEDVRARFVVLAKSHHPDAHGNVIMGGGRRVGRSFSFQGLCDAKDLLVKHLEQSND